jgi:SAM-dependent methyltransferase
MRQPQPRAKAWLDFWNGETFIYANERHKRLHYELVARDIATLVRGPAARVLDYGCGEALSAQRVAEGCERLFLYDAAPNLRRRLNQRFRVFSSEVDTGSREENTIKQGNSESSRRNPNRKDFSGEPRIEIVEDGALAAIEDASLDLIVVNSLIQYVGQEELPGLLALWRSRLKPEGRLLLSDIPTPAAGAAFHDTLALLQFGWRGGFLSAALASLGKLYFSDYRRLRKELGFFAYEPRVLEERLRRAGFTAARLPLNIGHNQTRFSLLAAKTGAGAGADLRAGAACGARLTRERP